MKELLIARNTYIRTFDVVDVAVAIMLDKLWEARLY